MQYSPDDMVALWNEYMSLDLVFYAEVDIHNGLVLSAGEQYLLVV